MPILLDTNVYLFAIRSEEGAAFFEHRFLPLVFQTHLSSIVVEELYAGALDAQAERLVESYVGALERAGRVADFIELGELLARDALHREESCGGHFRVEHQTEDGEAKRNDENFSYVAAWEYAGLEKAPILNKEPLSFEYVKPSQRSYK